MKSAAQRFVLWAFAGLRARRSDDRGLTAPWLVVMSAVIPASLSVIVDVGRAVNAQRAVSGTAFEICRAASQGVGAAGLRSGSTTVDIAAAQTRAVRAARALLVDAPATLVAVTVDGDRATVTLAGRFDAVTPFVPSQSFTEAASCSLRERG
jgi:hypothetical protein